MDFRLGNETPRIYGQRFDQWGQPLWGSTGANLVDWPGIMGIGLDDVTYDSPGGFYITFTAADGTGRSDLFCQKFDGNANRPWGNYGLPVAGGPGDQIFSQVVSDQIGGTLIVFDNDPQGVEDYHLWAQHLDANGNRLLGTNGSPPYFPGTWTPIGCLDLADGFPDFQGGAVFAYSTNAYYNALKALRVNAQGRSVWSWDSGPLAQHFITEALQNPSDGTLWIEANDNRTGSFLSYLYHLDLNGNPIFNSQGIPGGECMAPTNNGVITFKTFLTSSNGTKVLAKRVTNEGTQIWESIVALCEIPWGTTSLNPISSTSDVNDGSVVAMLDRRTQLQQPYDVSNIATQRVRANGEIGNPVPPKYFHPGGEVQFGGGLQSLPGNLIQLTLSQPDYIALQLYDVLGRKVLTLLEGYHQAGEFTAPLNAVGLPSGLYFLHLSTPAEQQTAKIVISR